MESGGVQFFFEFTERDLLILAEGAKLTLIISSLAIVGGTILGGLFGWLLSIGGRVGAITLGWILDIFRSVPPIVQLVLFVNFFPIIGFPVDAAEAGTLVLMMYCSALVAQVARAGIEAVPKTTRWAGRSLGMSYWQDLRYVVLPIGLRAVLPSWTGVALGVLKDSALVSVLKAGELMQVSQEMITRTQQPFLILGIAGLFYFALSFPIARLTEHLERRWQHD